MKKQALRVLLLVAAMTISGLIVIAGELRGCQSEIPLPIYPGKFCREAMTEELGAPKEEIDQLRATSARATSGPAHR